jgi:hypothetical protein
LFQRLIASVLVVLLLAPTAGVPRPAHAQLPADFDLPVVEGAHFFSQADGQNGLSGMGFAVSNIDGVPFWDYFRAAGGVAAFGYPISHRFLWNGFVVQAFQKVVFQWRPDYGTVFYVNILDEIHARGLDGYLRDVRQVPPQADWRGDAGLPSDAVIARHLALLNGYPALATAYFQEQDWLNRNGLPMAPIQNMGNVLVLRTQRKVFQQWLVNTPWARAGEVVIANGGDLGKETGLYPNAAIFPRYPLDVPLSIVDLQFSPVNRNPATIRLNPNWGTASTVVFVQGAGFPASQTVQVRLGPAGGSLWPDPYATARTNADGAFQLSFTMPARWPDDTLIPSTTLQVVATVGAISASALFYYNTPFPGGGGPPPAVCNGDEQITFNPANPVRNQTFQIIATSARGSTNVGLIGSLPAGFVGVFGGGKGTQWIWQAITGQVGRYDFYFTISGTVCATNFVQVS